MTNPNGPGSFSIVSCAYCGDAGLIGDSSSASGQRVCPYCVQMMPEQVDACPEKCPEDTSGFCPTCNGRGRVRVYPADGSPQEGGRSYFCDCPSCVPPTPASSFEVEELEIKLHTAQLVAGAMGVCWLVMFLALIKAVW
jgi:hypothetical protein